MAEIYDKHGNELAVGLQSSSECDEALRAARNIAAYLGEQVYLEDDNKEVTVYANGTVAVFPGSERLRYLTEFTSMNYNRWVEL